MKSILGAILYSMDTSRVKLLRRYTSFSYNFQIKSRLRRVQWHSPRFVGFARVCILIPSAVWIVDASQAIVVSSRAHYQIDLLYPMIRRYVKSLMLLRNFHGLYRFAWRDIENVQQDRLGFTVIVDPLYHLVNATIAYTQRRTRALRIFISKDKINGWNRDLYSQRDVDSRTNTYWNQRSRRYNPDRYRQSRCEAYRRPIAWAWRPACRRPAFRSRARSRSPWEDGTLWNSKLCPATFLCRWRIGPDAVPELCWIRLVATRYCCLPVPWTFRGKLLE